MSEHVNDTTSLVEVLYWSTAQADPHPETTHTEHVLAYQVKGRLKIDHGEPLLVEPGMLTILPAGVPHRTLGGSDIGLWLVRFCPVCHDLAEHSPLMEAFRLVRLGMLPVVAIAEHRHDHLLYLLKQLKQETSETTPETGESLKALLRLVLVESVRAIRSNPGDRTVNPGGLTGEALTYIQANCLNSISLKDVAAAIHRAPTHVAATVKKDTGFSVGQWITSGRIAEAASLLAHSDESIEAIAGRVGWRDVTHFIRQFRKNRGTTPAAWRTAHRRTHGSLNP